MRSEFIAISGSGAAALFVAGLVLGWTLAHPDLAGFLIAGLGLLLARDDARLGFVSGSYVRGWLLWKRSAP